MTHRASSMSSSLLLGIDVGTTSCKVAVFDLRGRRLGFGTSPTPAYCPGPNLAEHDPDELWKSVVSAVREALERVDSRRVRSVAVASVSEAGVPLDATGRHTYPVIAWFDGRTVSQNRWWLENIGQRFTSQTTGLTPHSIFGACKLMWIRDHAPDAYAKTRTWLNVADYIAFRLSGVKATDYSMASRTMLLDLSHLRWSEQLVDRAGLNRGLLPELVASGSRLGTITGEAAHEMGLPADTVVGAGGHDHVCGAFAVGVNEEGKCLDSMGTAEAVFIPLTQAKLEARSLGAATALGVHVSEGRFYAMGGLKASGAITSWASKLLRYTDATNGGLRRLEAEAARAPAGSLGVFFLPNLVAGDRGAFLGLTTGAESGTMARAVYEGLAYEWRHQLDLMESALNIKTDTIKVIGGGTKSKLWLQIKADVLGRPLHVINQGEDSVALGAALLGGIAAGLYTDEEDALSQIRISQETIVPVEPRASFYDHCYKTVYAQLDAKLADVFEAIDEVQQISGGGA